MRERFFAAWFEGDKPEFQSVYWFNNKEDLTKEINRLRTEYPKARKNIIAGKLLNIPKTVVDGISTVVS